MKGTVLFITGIDTNIGKTFATGMIACALAEKGKKVITQKMIQTGCTEVSEDIEMHRKIQGIPFTEEDKAGLTCPYIFTYPCSPHMAAGKTGRQSICPSSPRQPAAYKRNMSTSCWKVRAD